jgi:signal transduction histidine kinase
MTSLGIATETPLLSRMLAWFRPTSTDRDVAFRERIIRSTVALVILLGIFSLLSNIFVFRGEFTLISYYTMNILALVGCIAAAWMVARQRILASGWLLVIVVLMGAASLALLSRQDESEIGLVTAIPALMFVPLVAALVLPRNTIMGTSLLTIIAYSLAQFVVHVNDFGVVGIDNSQLFSTAAALLLMEGALLRLLRVEFDGRLDSMRDSILQTELAKQEAEIARQRAEDERQRAEESDRAKSQFLANMSHELRTPLNAIIGYDEAMLGGMAGTFTAKQTELLQRIQANSRRLLGLINDVLDLSKIESGSVEVFLSPISPRKIIGDSVENLRSLASGKSLNLVVEIPDDVPELVLGDTNKIQQIAVNLISNAIKFTSQGEVRVSVVAGQGEFWQFKVQDTGIGISDSLLPHLFEPFRQDNSPVVYAQKGTGLGLSISKRLAEAMGGSIEVSTKVGVGTVFTVSLPRASVPEPAKMPA